MTESLKIKWQSRGLCYTRRLTMDRITMDPRLQKIDQLKNQEEKTINQEENSNNNGETAQRTNENAGTERDNSIIQQIENLTLNKENEKNETISQEKDNVAKSEPKTIEGFWCQTSTFVRDLFTMNPDNIFFFATPRIASISVYYMNSLLSLMEYGPGLQESAEGFRVLSLIERSINIVYGTNAYIFDCGYFETVRRRHGLSFISGSFSDGNVCSTKYFNCSAPSLENLFLIASSVASCLSEKPKSIAIFLAPSYDCLCAVMVASMVYCREGNQNDLIINGREFIKTFDEQIHSTNRFQEKLQKTFRWSNLQNDIYQKDWQTRFAVVVHILNDFIFLLSLRDTYVERNLQELSLEPGSTIVFEPEPIFIESVVIMMDKQKESETAHGTVRPYMTIQTLEGKVLYSSMVHGIHTVEIAFRPYEIPVNKFIKKEDAEFTLKVYNLPENGNGKQIFAVRMHSSLLAHRLRNNSCDYGFLYLRMMDFDFVCEQYSLSDSITMHINYALSPNFKKRESADWHPETAFSANFAVDSELMRTTEIESALREIFPQLNDNDISFHANKYKDSDDPIATAIEKILATQIGISIENSDNSFLTNQSDEPTTLQSMIETRMHYSNSREQQINISSIAERLQLPTYIFHRNQLKDEEECLICLSPFLEGERIKTLPCFHYYHINCVDKWILRFPKCPICQLRIHE